MDLANLSPEQLRRLIGDPRNAHVRAALERRLAELEASADSFSGGRKNGNAAVAAGAPVQRELRSAPVTPGGRPAPLVYPGSLRLTLFGPPRTKKTSNQLQRHGGRLKVIPSAAWMAWRDALLATGQLPVEAPLPDQPYNCAAVFYRASDVGDLVGFQQGLADVLEEGGVLSNDRWIQAWDGTRLALDRACPRVEITLSPLR